MIIHVELYNHLEHLGYNDIWSRISNLKLNCIQILPCWFSCKVVDCSNNNQCDMTDYCHCLKMSGPCQVSSPLKHSWELGTTTHMSSSFYMSILLLKLSQHLRYLGLFLSNLHQTKWECCDIDILIEMKDVKTCFISNCKRVTGSLIIHYILTVNVNILFEISLDDNIVYWVYM